MRPLYLLLLLAACQQTAPTPSPETAPADGAEATAEAEAPAPEAIHEHMKEHFEKVTAARDALVNSDLAGTREPLTWLAGHDIPRDQLPKDAIPYAEAMQAAAKRGAEAEDLVNAAGAVADVAVQCGACHQSTGKGPAYEPGTPPEGEDIQVQMQRYHWAADRMWEGLVGRDDAAWKAGAMAMKTVPLEGVTKVDGSEAPPEVAAFAKTITSLGAEGLEPGEPAKKAALYADFVGTCGACHAGTDGGPAAASARVEEEAAPLKGAAEGTEAGGGATE
jgi:mono/diheme cytochrome c family protein